MILSQWTVAHWAPQQWREDGGVSVAPPSVWKLGQMELLALTEKIAAKIKQRPHGKP